MGSFSLWADPLGSFGCRNDYVYCFLSDNYNLDRRTTIFSKFVDYYFEKCNESELSPAAETAAILSGEATAIALDCLTLGILPASIAIYDIIDSKLVSYIKERKRKKVI